MNNQKYYYIFLEPLSKELALLAKELEHSVFSSPRTMLTHSRVLIENILKNLMKIEKLTDSLNMSILERINTLSHQGYLVPNIVDALHHVRKVGNEAAHDTRVFRYSESLLCWEALYKIVKWYIESYGPLDLSVPEYQEPSQLRDEPLDLAELLDRLKSLEEKLSSPETQAEVAVTTTDINYDSSLSGYAAIRRIKYFDKHLDIPYFLRDTFLLPQRFHKSETFLIRLGEVQQARFMSELPNSLIDLHKHVNRYNEKNDKTFFEELALFVQEEITRRKIENNRRGELLFFYKTDFIVVTEELSKISLTTQEFSGIPSLIKQLNQNEIYTVGQLPKELVSLAKYKNVGTLTIENLFMQLKEKQGAEVTGILSRI
ncbi:DUF4145 domain-containing protein [Sutcliffiella horikoshii]|uniref:DUF4145 domain-containing protein n=1 Tax=Sutcliffiella horikoshii TaxID=79883 RepID=UPI00384C5094